MNILVIDRDDLMARMIKAHLEPIGHMVTHETSKSDAVAAIETRHFDMIIADPAPLTSAMGLVQHIKQKMRKYPYIVLAGEYATAAHALESGASQTLQKPVNKKYLDQIVDNAQTIASLVQRLGDTEEDFPSAGGIIAKSAFNQLFLSALERADRYAENTYIVFISVDNYASIAERIGQSEARVMSAELSQFLSRIRRQSDIIGQTKPCEYALLLQRPAYAEEPMDATKRFADAFDDYRQFFDKYDAEISIKLLDIPSGHIAMARTVR